MPTSIERFLLNLKRPAGRDAYPSDLFYLHSQLLERAGAFKDEISKGTITCLPIIETVQDDYATLLATNVISITDGQIITDSDIAKKGIYPSINLGLSVSRTGSSVQNKLIKSVAKDISKTIVEYWDTKRYEMISLEISEKTKQIIAKGKHLTDLFEQPNYKSYTPMEMMIYSRIINTGATSKISNNFNEFLKNLGNDKTWLAIYDKISNDEKELELVDTYFKMVTGQVNKYNAKRMVEDE